MAVAAETADRDSRRLRGSNVPAKDGVTQVQREKGEPLTTDSSAVNKVEHHKPQLPGGTRERPGRNKRDCVQGTTNHHAVLSWTTNATIARKKDTL